MVPAAPARVVESGPDPILGAGLYSLSELSRYLASRKLAASPSKVLRWIQDGLAVSDHQRGAPTYSFHDLVSLLVVGWLRSRGVSLSAIRSAEAYLREARGLERPFALEEIYTDGVNVLYRASPVIAEQLTAANRRGQEIMAREAWRPSGTSGRTSVSILASSSGRRASPGLGFLRRSSPRYPGLGRRPTFSPTSSTCLRSG